MEKREVLLLSLGQGGEEEAANENETCSHCSEQKAKWEKLLREEAVIIR